MKINFIYNSLTKDIDLKELFKDISEDVHVYDMSYPKEAKKGWVILNRYAAKDMPFMEITDGSEEDNILYVSYGEVNKVITNKDIKELIKNYSK